MECWCNIDIYIEKMPNIGKRSYIVCMTDFIQTRKIKFKGALLRGLLRLIEGMVMKPWHENNGAAIYVGRAATVYNPLF